MRYIMTQNVSKAISVLLSVVIVLGVFISLQVIVSAQLIESFEGGWGDWYPDMNYDPAYFNIDLSSLYAYDGSISIGIGSHGLPSPEITGWIERQVAVPPSSFLTVDLSFQLYSEGTDSPREVVAYIGNNNPSDYPDFTTIGFTDQVSDGWFEYTYSNSITTSPSGQIFVALGVYNHIVGFKTYWVDYVVISGITIDNDPPEISNLQPTNETTISDNQPIISANYTDTSGVSIPSIVLQVDGVNMTSASIVTDSGVSYTPSLPLTEGRHDIYLEATDMSPNQNRAEKTWWFMVDTLPPLISNEQPANMTTIGSETPLISADFLDATSGTNMSSVKLMVNTVDVTAQATITPNKVTYLPTTPLSEGPNEVYIEVGDNSHPQNVGKKLWTFSIDTTPPAITNLQPINNSQTSDASPSISANYSDSSSIDTGSVSLEVDGFDVTMLSSVTASGVSYLPSFPLSDGLHTAHLTVADISGNTAEALWFFYTDATSPTTNLNILSPQFIDPLGRTFISTATYLNLTSDDGNGSGVDMILYLFYADGESEPSYSQYAGDFTIPESKSDGLIYLKFKGVDKLGNEENPQLHELYLDNTPPTTDLTLGAPSYLDSGILYVAISTTFTLSSSDNDGSGVAAIYYGVDDPGCSTIYTSSISLASFTEGFHTLYFMSEDRVENKESPQSFSVYLDTSAPETNVLFGNPSYSYQGVTYVSSETPIDFLSEDGSGSGVATTWYRILKGGVVQVDWTEYIGNSVFISGEDGFREIAVKSIDNLANEEIERRVTIFLDSTPPTSSAPEYEQMDVNYVNNTLASIVIIGEDGSGSGVEEIKFGIDDPTTPNTYSGPIVVGIMTEGRHTIYLRAIDRVGNTESIHNFTLVLDITPPLADAGEDTEVIKGETAVLDASGSSDNISGIAEYMWTFSIDGNSITLEGVHPSFRFDVEGSFLVTLTVKDAAGNKNTDTMTITVVKGGGSGLSWWIWLIIALVALMLIILFLLSRKRENGMGEERRCVECGHPIRPEDRICPECNSPIATAPRK